MLRTSREVRPLGPADHDAALEICSRDPVANVYVAARILEAETDGPRGPLLGYCPDGPIAAVAWACANLVPAGTDEAGAEAIGARLRRQRSQYSSIFGPTEQVRALWATLSPSWRRPLDVRARQPLLVMGESDPFGVPPDARVRPARADELDLVVPAAAAMFTEEIGYAPFGDSRGRAAYRASCRRLIARGHTFVLVEDGRIVFKAEIGSVGLGVGQMQGVWVDPSRRGEGIAAPALAAVVELARERIAPVVSLYVNDFNTAALAAYRTVGFREVGTFSTILL